MKGKNLLQIKILQSGKDKKYLAAAMNIRIETFRIKMNTNGWKVSEILILIDALKLTANDVMDIFFYEN